MLNQIKKIFYKNKKDQTVDTSISYTLSNNNIKVNINIPHYSPEIMEDLAVLIHSINSRSTLQATIDMIKESLETNEPQLLVEFLLNMTTLSNINTPNSTKNKPCISPSDMI